MKQNNNNTEEKVFPPILAKTWLDIISHTDDEALRNDIIERLTRQFGSIMKANNYVDEHFGTS